MDKTMIPILMYHSIQEVPRSEVMKSLHVKPSSFALQMQLLRLLGYRGCSVSEATNALQTSSSERLVGLTFDDGYENFFVNALPVLKRLRFSATVYCVSDLIGTSNVWDHNSGISHNNLMSEKQIKMCLADGIEIGCHSATHKSLPSATEHLSQEICAARWELERRFDTSVSTFCYPYGHFNSAVMKAVAEAGFTSATTMIRSRATSTDSNLLLPRIPVTWHTTAAHFLLKILTGYEDRRRQQGA